MPNDSEFYFMQARHFKEQDIAGKTIIVSGCICPVNTLLQCSSQNSEIASLCMQEMDILKLWKL
jgi:hypothetical protein